MHIGVKAVHTARGEESNNELAVSLQHDISSPQPAHSFWMFLQTHLSRIPPVSWASAAQKRSVRVQLDDILWLGFRLGLLPGRSHCMSHWRLSLSLSLSREAISGDLGPSREISGDLSREGRERRLRVGARRRLGGPACLHAPMEPSQDVGDAREMVWSEARSL